MAAQNRSLRSSALLVALLTAVSSCSTSPEDAGTVVVDGGPDVGYPGGRSAWLADGTIYYLMSLPGESDSPRHLYRTRIGAGAGEELHLASVASCDIPYPEDLRPLAGGGLGAILQCPQQGTPSSLVSINTTSGHVDQLSDLDGNDVGIWSDVEHQGWVTAGGPGCASIAPIHGRGVSAMPVLEPASLLPWALDGDFSAPEDCTERGAIGYVQAAPTMSRVIALASPEAAGIAPGDAGKNRANLPWHLYELDLSAHRIRLIGGSFTRPIGMSIGAGKAVVVASQNGAAGIYTVDLQQGTTTLVGRGDFGPPASSPDGRLVLLTDYPPGAGTRLVVWPVP